MRRRRRGRAVGSVAAEGSEKVALDFVEFALASGVHRWWVLERLWYYKRGGGSQQR